METTNNLRVILIAEDSPTQAENLRYFLERHGYKVVAAKNGREALELMAAHKPHLLISDIVMPEMDGYELCHCVRTDRELSDLPIIFLTVLSDPADIMKSLECGADSFIIKPFKEEPLIERIRLLLVSQDLHKHKKPEPVEVAFHGKKYIVNADRLQIMNLLVSTYEAAVDQNKQLIQAQKELRERTAELEAANRDLESFTYSVSHDLKAPVRAIQGFARILMSEQAEGLDAEALRLLQAITDNTKNMHQLIDDLLAFSRLGRQEIRKDRVNLAAMVRKLVEQLKSQEPERDLQFLIKDLPPAFADKSMLNQVLLNLLENAVKYTKPRNTAVIEVAGTDKDNETVYYIKDNGIGFDETYADKLFGVFQRLQVQGEYEGTGVGLAIVKRGVERHGGRVWAEGKIDKGATFFFTLPKNNT